MLACAELPSPNTPLYPSPEPPTFSPSVRRTIACCRSPGGFASASVNGAPGVKTRHAHPSPCGILVDPVGL